MGTYLTKTFPSMDGNGAPQCSQLLLEFCAMVGTSIVTILKFAPQL